MFRYLYYTVNSGITATKLTNLENKKMYQHNVSVIRNQTSTMVGCSVQLQLLLTTSTKITTSNIEDTLKAYYSSGSNNIIGNGYIIDTSHSIFPTINIQLVGGTGVLKIRYINTSTTSVVAEVDPTTYDAVGDTVVQII